MSGVGATGGSARTIATGGEADEWRAHPLLALTLRSVVLVAPIVASVVVAHSVGLLLPRPAGLAGILRWWLPLLGVAMLTMVCVDRLARRLLPLAALLRLSLVFPDQAPARYKVALRSGTSRELEERLSDGGSLGDDAGAAARNLLSVLADLSRHDRLTRGHSERVRAYSVMIGEEMGLSRDDLDKLQWSALAHDVGKLRVPGEILRKAGRPSDAEWKVLRTHPASAEQLVAPMRPWLGDWLDAATQHHERFDGAGYPRGLSGDEISLSGRIVAVADAFDTMTSVRSYKAPLSLADARVELARNACTQFDPDVVRAFLQVGMGRLRLTLGPMAWVAQLPFVAESTIAGSTGGLVSGGASLAAGASLVAASVVAPWMPEIDEPADASASASSAEPGDDPESLAPPAAREVPASGRDPRPVDPGSTTTTTTTTPRPVEDTPTTSTQRPGSGGPQTDTGTEPGPSDPPAPTPTVPSPLDEAVAIVLGLDDQPATSPSVPKTPAAVTTSPPPSTTTTVTTTVPPTTAPGPPGGSFARDDAYAIRADRVVWMDVVANDRVDRDSLELDTLRVVVAPDHAQQIVVRDGVIRYRSYPATHELFSPNDSFVYEVCTDDACARATVTIVVA